MTPSSVAVFILAVLGVLFLLAVTGILHVNGIA
jgi:cobalamin synthase